MMKTRRNKIVTVIAIIVIAGMMMGIVTYGRSNELWTGFGIVTEKKQEGDEYLTTVVFDKLEKTFEGKAIYDSFEKQENIEVVLLKKKIFCFTYETEMRLTGGSKK